MKLVKFMAGTALALLLAVAAPGFAAGIAVVDYVGFGWETGGLAASAPGDQFSVATVVTQIDPRFGVNLGSSEATLYITGLTSQGAVTDPFSGVTTITYTGGTLAVYGDPSRNHDWGTYPANGTVPSTFTDGTLLFSGTFQSFSLSLLPSGAGAYEGLLNGTGGSALAYPCSGCAYTFAGTFAAPTGAQIPAGYDVQVDGTLELEGAVPVQNVNWGSLKQLYNPGR